MGGKADTDLTLRLEVNGRTHRIAVDARMTLLDALREGSGYRHQERARPRPMRRLHGPIVLCGSANRAPAHRACRTPLAKGGLRFTSSLLTIMESFGRRIARRWRDISISISMQLLQQSEEKY